MPTRSLAIVTCAFIVVSCVLDRGGRGHFAFGGEDGAGAHAGGSGASGGQGGVMVGPGAGGPTDVGGGGVGGGTSQCGDGVVQPPETCDDANLDGEDGCADCAITLGFTCVGEPSSCIAIELEVDAGANLGIAITDLANHYDGTLSTMDCATLVHNGLLGTEIDAVEVEVAIDHPYLGDLILKVVSPEGTILTLMNRPGADEPSDDYNESPNGDSSNLAATSPIRFSDASADDAETMGSTINTNDVVCASDARCSYHPSPSTGPGMALSDFAHQSPVGTWRVCAADGDDVDAGTLEGAKLIVRASAPNPEGR